jgi:cyclic pyranopterin phosphate synthase
MPQEGFPATPKTDHLTRDEFVRLIKVAARLGITKIRLTGGEPLLRRDLVPLVSQISAIKGLEDLSCTTNGFLLSSLAKGLKDGGLQRINVSLDTLRDDRFQSIARRGALKEVLSGIEAALEVGLEPVKINCVSMRGKNDDEAADFARWTKNYPVHVRFIELMPIRWNLDETPARLSNPSGLLTLKQCSGSMLSDAELRRSYISAAEIKQRIENELVTLEVAEIKTNGPARTFKLPGARGTVGFISQISSDLCSRCNRLRLTHDGFLRPCLMSDGELNMREALRKGASDDLLESMFLDVVREKPERHYLADGQKVVGRGMSQIGG